MTENNDFIKNTVILGFSGIVVKILSAAYRIPLTRMIGAEGMGQYTAAFNFFMPFFSLATAGITPTISRLCASRQYISRADVKRIRRTACRWFGLSSRILAFCALCAGRRYAGTIDAPFIFIGVILLVPNLIFATFEAVYKGISHGTMNMAVSAKASVLESTGKLIIGVCSVYLAGTLLADHRAEGQLVCAFATVSICGLICLIYMHRQFDEDYTSDRKSNLAISAGTLFSMAVPISRSALVVSLSNFCDTAICIPVIKNIPASSIAAAYPFVSFSAVEEKAIWLYGIYQGLCLSVVNLIPSLSAAIGSSGLPLITKAVGTGDGTATHTRTEKLMKLTAAVVVPASLFVAFFPSEVLVTLYGDNGAQTTLAAFFLGIMAPAAIPAAFSFPLNSIMHANGKSAVIFRILLVSCSVKVVLSVWLCSMDRVNIMGCMFSQIIFHILVFALSVNAVKSVYRARDIFSRIVYPVMLSYILLSFIRVFSQFILYNVPVVFRTFFCGGIFVAVYFGVLLFTGFFVDNKNIK